MWVVERSDSSHRSMWTTRRDAKHYISYLGPVARMGPSIFDIQLPTGSHITASIVRN